MKHGSKGDVRFADMENTDRLNGKMNDAVNGVFKKPTAKSSTK